MNSLLTYSPLLLKSLLLSACLSWVAYAEVPPSKAAITPAPRTLEFDWMSVAQWHQLFEEDKQIAQKGNVDLLFIGDSITQGWHPELWETYFAPYKAANFGVGGDQTGNLLWRLENGGIENISPKVVVVMIGVNNYGLNSDTPEDVFEGVAAVVAKLRHSFPQAKILVNGILPFQEFADSPMRAPVQKTNALIKNLADNQQIFYRDFGPLLLEQDGSISKEIMPDFLHPAKPGYQILADAILPVVRPWLD